MKNKKNVQNKVSIKQAYSQALLLIVFFASHLLLFSACEKAEEQVVEEVVRPVKIITVVGAEDIMSRKFPGRVRASQRVDLAFQVSGPLIELPVDEGQDIKKDQVIARILPRDFKTEIDKARARALEAEQQYQRYRALYVQKQVSKADFDKYKSERDIATALQQEAQAKLNDTYLKAPFSGVIAKRYVENFEDVQAKQPIVSLQDISNIEVLIDLPENIISTPPKIGETVADAEFAAAPGKLYPLKMKEFSTEADSKTHTYQVTLEMIQPDDIRVLPGMTANVIGSRKVANVIESQIIIPAIAVFSDETGSSHVWKVNPETMTVQKQPVTTGELTGSDKIQILSGINSGDMIAVSAVSQLREGKKVRPMEQ
ncbi:MAG: efflux RND transporter periplasmic adaptor subunit [Desulfobacterales bacterium]|nr:efflux RND transporter periplasmic adaptor subunit [Desulfobacterales bacterium]